MDKYFGLEQTVYKACFLAFHTQKSKHGKQI